jgi:Zn-dependent protease/CBS domain-containing protein
MPTPIAHTKPGRIARVAGIDLYLHWSFLLLLGWIFMSHVLAGHGLSAAAQGVAFMATIFACVVLHELGHALMAKRFGVRTRDITLYPIGGVARLERMPERPREELLVAIAGPAVNFVIAGLLWLLSTKVALPDQLKLVGGHFASKVLYVNLSLGLFNLLPAFPMDGGRALRAVLAMRMDYVRATQVAASAGQALAILLGVAGLFSNTFLMFIALFVFAGARQEALLVQARAVLAGVPVTAAMLTRFQTVAATDPIARAVSLLQESDQEDFPVLRDDVVVGVLTRNDLLRALAAGRQHEAAAEAMTRSYEVVEDTEMLDATFRRMQEAGCTSLPVVRGGHLVGMITLEHVGKWLMVRGALGRGRDTHAA